VDKEVELDMAATEGNIFCWPWRKGKLQREKNKSKGGKNPTHPDEISLDTWVFLPKTQTLTPLLHTEKFRPTRALLCTQLSIYDE
jgi:hypothetical protein